MNNFNLELWTESLLLQSGMQAGTADILSKIIEILAILLVSIIADIVARKVILSLVKRYVKKSTNTYDDVFLDKKVFDSLAHLIPAAIIWYTMPWIFEEGNSVLIFARKAITLYMIVMVVVVLNRFLKALEHLALQSKKSEGKPISSYIQVINIVVYLIGTVLILSMLIGKSPITIITAFGAATAVVLLIFRDTILGFVASIQISANDMVRLGDWVSMTKYGADGNVTEINLTTVKVQNFDKTVTTVPTYAFISDSFKNWRAMENVGVRRIKRALMIDISTITFVDNAMIDEFAKIENISAYISEKQNEIAAYNEKHVKNTDVAINGRKMTNLGIFRNYALHYLQNHKMVSQNETVMVRQLQSNELGLPLEVYCFCTDTAWVNYENVQSDIFDHLLAAAQVFKLKIYQRPAGSDFRDGLAG